MDALAQGALDHLVDLHARLRKVIDGLDAAALEKVPREGENSIAVLVTHTLGSEMGWLHRAAGIDFKRDRDAEFRARGSAEALVALIDRADRRTPELFKAALDAGTATSRQLDSGTVTVGYCIAHAVSHGAEHVGHAELTRQLIR